VLAKKYKLLVQINGNLYESNLQAVPDESSIQSVTRMLYLKNNGNWWSFTIVALPIMQP
jgi:hypothetical protein